MHIVRLTRCRIFVSLMLLASIATSQEEAIDLSNLSGKQIYIQFCSRCHGEDGKGNIPEEMIQNMEAPPPDLTEPYFNSGEKRKSWTRVIKYGGGIEGLSMSMPAWGEAFSDQQINEMVEYMKTFVPASRYPQGESNFLRAHSVTKAFVEQEVLVIPTYTVKCNKNGRTTEIGNILYYADRFCNRFQYEVKVPVNSYASALRQVTGVGNVEVGFKYAFWDDYQTPAVTSVGIEVELPTGSESQGLGGGTAIIVPYAAGGLGLGQTLEFQASAKVKVPLDRNKGTPELVIGFSSTANLSDSRQGLFPGMELIERKDLSSGNNLISAIPKLFVSLTKKGHIAISVGREIPISGERPFDTRWVVFFLWEYADGGLWW